MTVFNTTAGTGEHHPYIISPRPDNVPLTAQEHYLGVDTVSWYVNKESSWFTERMATGILTISLAVRRLAVSAIQNARYDKFFEGLMNLRTGLQEGRAPNSEAERLFRSERKAAGAVRPLLIETAKVVELSRRVESSPDIFQSLPRLPGLLETLSAVPRIKN